MTARRRRGGIFDPDYRTKGWNKSAFAPKHSPLSMTQLVTALTVICFLPLYVHPVIRSVLLTLPGLLFFGSLALIFWLALGILLRRVMGRRVRRRLEDEAEALIPQEPVFKAAIQRRTYRPVMHPREFEHEVARLLNILTDYKAVVVGGAGDGGVDIKVYLRDHLVGVVQCKCYNPRRSLSPRHVRELYAVKAQHHVETAYLVTTASFTDDTRNEARRLGVKLVDGTDLQAMRIKAKAKLRAQDERQSSGIGSRQSIESFDQPAALD